ncbi:Rieske (2Fe-2S) protein [Gramella sp. AN32]|uniref:Ubiquinol-cytochrome c reductase iron-sulfur subunit n=1 Tax=Christiangramia antarctica TaxID=2058158 RepID=A0ABW5XC65_9FLAO|nr:Rieske (2Fe-2S) protein [Gramella sp. AN32]MCM4155433.1 Rieske [Gramella sp. AN32]
MKRGEFINSMGKGVLLVCSGPCLMTSCSSDDGGTDTPPPGGGPSTVSVNLSILSNVGDQTSKNGVLFFRIGAGNSASNFIATEALCPHQGGTLIWKQDNGFIECNLHFSRYETDGDVIQGPQGASGNTRDLKIYPVTISGDTITATKS